MKYLKYIGAFLLIIAVIWGVYSHYSITALENKNKELLKSNEALQAAMKAQIVQWQSKFDSLELRAKQLEATVSQINTQYAILAKRNIDLQNKISSLTVPVVKEARVAKFKELGYEGQGMAANVTTPYEGVLFDWPSSDKLLQVAMENPLIKEQNANLKEEVVLLEKKASTQDQIIKNTEQEVKMALDRAVFAENQIVAKDKIITEQGKVNADLVKKAKRGPIWFISGVVVGIAITIAAVVGLGL